MDVIRPTKSLKKIKFNLVFFCTAISLIGCVQDKELQELMVNYEKEKAVSVSFKYSGDPSHLQFFIPGEMVTPILGTLTNENASMVFRPVLPFSAKQQYEIRNKTKVLSTFAVDDLITAKTPELLAIYPSKDTVPENLLKVYLQFSQPMQEVGESLSFITVTDMTTSKEVSVFLELESELWNKSHDRLTLWLDPGRIKTDLIPNKNLGPPLLEGHNYAIHISSQWKSAKGIPLDQEYKKELYITTKDDKKPVPEHWNITPPTATTKAPLRIDFGESMDAILALETITLLNDKEQRVAGTLKLSPKEEAVMFTPVKPWKKGSYTILIASKLEDLSGNNLSRLFDTDLHQKQTSETNSSFKSINFKVL